MRRAASPTSGRYSTSTAFASRWSGASATRLPRCESPRRPPNRQRCRYRRQPPDFSEFRHYSTDLVLLRGAKRIGYTEPKWGRQVHRHNGPADGDRSLDVEPGKGGYAMRMKVVPDVIGKQNLSMV